MRVTLNLSHLHSFVMSSELEVVRFDQECTNRPTQSSACGSVVVGLVEFTVLLFQEKVYYPGHMPFWENSKLVFRLTNVL